MTVRKETDYWCGQKLERDIYQIRDRKIVVDGRMPRIARLKDEYAVGIGDPEAIIAGLVENGCPADILTFWDRVPLEGEPLPYHCEKLAQALLPVTTYEEWWTRQISKQARKNIKRATRSGVEIRFEPFSDRLLREIKEIFDETPIRRGKPCWHYRKPIEELRGEIARDLDDSEFILAYHEDELIGFVKLIYRDKFADPAIFTAKTAQFDKYPNNILVAKCVERCAEKGLPYVHYSDWRLKPHAEFLRRHDFRKIEVNRYYVPLNLRGRRLLASGLHRPLSSRIPPELKVHLLKIREWWVRKRLKV